MRALLVVLALLLATAAPASAGTFKPSLPLDSASNGIALGADGNYWVAEQAANSIAKVSPRGEVLGHVAVGGGPVDVTAGPDGFIWASVTGAR